MALAGQGTAFLRTVPGGAFPLPLCGPCKDEREAIPDLSILVVKVLKLHTYDHVCVDVRTLFKAPFSFRVATDFVHLTQYSSIDFRIQDYFRQIQIRLKS
jgi:hypothetical protein